MKKNDWSRAAEELKRDMAAIERGAMSVSGRFLGLCTLLESFKVDIVESKLKTSQRKIAQAKGFAALRQDKGKLWFALGSAAAGLALGSAQSKDGYSGLAIGLDFFDASLRGLGKSQYAVSLDEQLLVVPRSQIYPGKRWVTWESLHEALEGLKNKALTGEQLHDLQTVISKLREDHTTLRHLAIVTSEQGNHSSNR